MKYPVLFFLFLLFNSCQNGTPNAPANDGVVASQTKSPVPYSTDSPELLRDFIRTTMRTEFPLTLPEKSGDGEVTRSYSFDVETRDDKLMWIIKVKWRDAKTDKLFAGSEYQLLWDNVDVNSIKIDNTPDGKRTSISIRPTVGNTFLYHPYSSSERDLEMGEAVIGWYDRGQEATLLRACTYMKQLAENMGKWGI